MGYRPVQCVGVCVCMSACLRVCVSVCVGVRTPHNTSFIHCKGDTYCHPLFFFNCTLKTAGNPSFNVEHTPAMLISRMCVMLMFAMLTVILQQPIAHTMRMILNDNDYILCTSLIPTEIQECQNKLFSTHLVLYCISTPYMQHHPAQQATLGLVI